MADDKAHVVRRSGRVFVARYSSNASPTYQTAMPLLEKFVNQHESRIRDYLCQHLELVEPGMELIQKEFRIQSEVGAGGSIDILARDIFGHLVIIEIKRSDQAARAALHELSKYVALLKSSQGVQPERIRALLLSTEWHELTVPFSEYLKSAEVATEGFVLDASEDGQVRGMRRFEPIALAQPLQIERSQIVYFFEKSDMRDASIRDLVTAAGLASISDFAVFNVDYNGENSEVIYPHGAYFVFSSPVDHDNPEDLEKFVSDTGMTWEKLDEPSENILCWLGEFVTFERDDVEIGYPEKLTSMVTNGWLATVAHRVGRYSLNQDVLSDTVLLAEAMRVEGGAAFYMYRSASPKFKPSWEVFKKDLALVVLGCFAWESILNGILERVELERPQSMLSLQLYNSADIVIAMIKAFGCKDFRYFPTLQLVDSSSERVCIYVGALAWDGGVVSRQGNEFLKEIFGGPEDYLMKRHFGVQHEYYDQSCTVLGLESVIFEVLNPGSQEEVIRLLRGPKARGDLKSSIINDFIAANGVFGSSLVKTMQSYTVGLV